MLDTTHSVYVSHFLSSSLRCDSPTIYICPVHLTFSVIPILPLVLRPYLGSPALSPIFLIYHRFLSHFIRVFLRSAFPPTVSATSSCTYLILACLFLYHHVFAFPPRPRLFPRCLFTELWYSLFALRLCPTVSASSIYLYFYPHFLQCISLFPCSMRLFLSYLPLPP